MDVRLRQTFLESFGISCRILNESIQTMRGDFAPIEVELIILDENQLADAKKYLLDFDKAPNRDEPNWMCPKCGEAITSQFTECWKCGASKSEG